MVVAHRRLASSVAFTCRLLQGQRYLQTVQKLRVAFDVPQDKPFHRSATDAQEQHSPWNYSAPLAIWESGDNGNSMNSYTSRHALSKRISAKTVSSLPAFAPRFRNSESSLYSVSTFSRRFLNSKSAIAKDYLTGR